MKAVLLLSARSTSKRLPNKHLLDLWEGKSPLQILCARLAKTGAPVCIATTTDSSDDVFENAHIKDVYIFRGSRENIPYRQLQAAKSLGADLIVSVDGDDILTAPEGITAILNHVKSDKGSQKKLYYTTGLPLGMNASAYSVSLLENLLKGKESTKLETGWGRVFGDTERVEIPQFVTSYPDKKVRFTLDYPEDLAFFRKVASHFQEKIFTVSTADIVQYVVDNKIYELNESIVEEYWNNFYREKGLEENASK